MDIIGKNYHITYDPETTTISCQGALQLYGADGYFSIAEFEKSRTAHTMSEQPHESRFATLMELFNDIIGRHTAMITVNIQKLQKLNSSGINVLSKFVIKFRDRQVGQLIIQGSHEFPWQSRVLENLQKILPEIIVKWV
jgi:hypothetical protein